MKLLINKPVFLRSWQLAERSVGSRSALTVLTGVRCTADDEKVTLQATDLKTSITCRADGVDIESAGESVFPVRVVGELFKKAPSEAFSVEVKDGKAQIVCSEKNKYTFTTYPVEEFPKLPASDGASPFFETTAGEMRRLLEEGTFAGSPGEEFPQYLSAGLFQVKEGSIRVVSTDGRRLSLSQSPVERPGENEQVLLPLTGLKELMRVLVAQDEDIQVTVKIDDAQAYFIAGELEFAVRRVESRFPPYEKILAPEKTTWMIVDRNHFIEALERAEIIVRDYSRMVIFNLSPGGALQVESRAPEIGEAIEDVAAEVDGESLRVAFNVKYLLEGLKALHGNVAHLTFNGPNGQMLLSKPNEDSFMYVLMPITLPEEEESTPD
ncbi:MAG: DNA polymerase III subunit beta [Thermovirgaceae bacterium]